MRAAAVAALAILPLTGCPWPTYFPETQQPRNTEPRIVRDPTLTNPMYEADDLEIPGQDDPRPVIDINLCVWEPDLEDDVEVRIFVDYGLNDLPPPAPLTSRTIGPGAATEEDPEIRCIQIQFARACNYGTTADSDQLVDVVVAQQFNDDNLDPPAWRRSFSGYTDEFRFKVHCLAP
jgi:hypothetical protein